MLAEGRLLAEDPARGVREGTADKASEGAAVGVGLMSGIDGRGGIGGWGGDAGDAPPPRGGERGAEGGVVLSPWERLVLDDGGRGP